MWSLTVSFKLNWIQSLMSERQRVFCNRTGTCSFNNSTAQQAPGAAFTFPPLVWCTCESEKDGNHKCLCAVMWPQTFHLCSLTRLHEKYQRKAPGNHSVRGVTDAYLPCRYWMSMQTGQAMPTTGGGLVVGCSLCSLCWGCGDRAGVCMATGEQHNKAVGPLGMLLEMLPSWEQR